jgi:hypothetical protein
MSVFQLPAISTAVPLPCSRCNAPIPPGDVMWDEKGPVCCNCIEAECTDLPDGYMIKHLERR